GTNPFIPPQDLPLADPELSGSASGTVEEVRDGDPETYAEVVCEDYNSWILSWPQYEHVVGFRAMYSFVREDERVLPAGPVGGARFGLVHRSTSAASPPWSAAAV